MRRLQMKSRVVAAVFLTLGACVSVFSQDIAGTWQGTLNGPAASLRVVFKINREADQKLTGQSFSIDQGGAVIPMNAITVEGRSVKWRLDAVGASYEGTFAGDGNTINGNMTLGQPTPMVLTRATPETAWAIPEPPAALKPMDP